MRYLLLAPLLFGCSAAGEHSLVNPGAEDTLGREDYLRVDVYPSGSNPGLLPETALIHDRWAYLDIRISTPISYSGTVTAFKPYPTSDATIPGDTETLAIKVRAWVPGTVLGNSDVTDTETGRYQFDVVPGTGYSLALVPEEDSTIPFLVETGQRFLRDMDEEHHLEPVAWVHGRIRSMDEGVDEAQVRLLHSPSGIAGPAASVDANGYFHLPYYHLDAYDLLVGAQEGARNPVPEYRIPLEIESGEWPEVNVEMGSLTTARVSGSVVDNSGGLVSSAKVRFSSDMLDCCPDGSMEVETDTDSRGSYSALLLPGEWLVEYVPPRSTSLSPVERDLVLDVSDSYKNLDDVSLPPSERVSSQIVDPLGYPVGKVGVVATEMGFYGYTYSAMTDSMGSFDLEIPATDMRFTLFPPDSSAAITMIEGGDLDFPGDFPEWLSLALGELVEGVVSHDGEPVTFALVEVRDAAGTLYGSTLTGEDGTFSVRVDVDEEDWAGEDYEG